MDPRKEFIAQLRRYRKGSISRRHFLGVTGLGTAVAALAASMPELVMPRRAYGADLGDRVSLTSWPNYHDPEELREIHRRDRREGRAHRLRLQRGDVCQAEGGRHRLGRLRAHQLHHRELCRGRSDRASGSGADPDVRSLHLHRSALHHARHGERQGLCGAQGLGHHRLLRQHRQGARSR